MINLEESEPSNSRGVILVAFNTETVNYLKIAECAAKLIKKHMNLPVSVITDVDVESEHFNTIKFIPTNKKNSRYNVASSTNQQWRNFDRYKVYELSPYETTLVLDTDYLVFDDQLNKYFDICVDYLIAGEQTFLVNNSKIRMGSYGIPHLWATIIMFKKTKTSSLFFDLVRRIQTNYVYYKNLYLIKQPPYRNDHAFTIAHNILSGYTVDIEKTIPSNVLVAFDAPIESMEIKSNTLIVRAADKSYVLPKSNLHVMDKAYLNTLAFETLINNYIENE
jgi:hypothetical protein